MLTIEQQEAILYGEASFYTFNTRDTLIDGDKWYYLYLENDHYKLGREFVKYILSDKDGVIFEGTDFAAGTNMDTIGDKSAEALLSFLTCREYDVDEEYFKDYTPRQLEFRDCEAEDLYVWREQLNSEEI